MDNTLPGHPRLQEKADGGLIDTWELTHQVDDQGDQKLPKDNDTRTLIEFTDQGKVHFNKMNKQTADSRTIRSATYAMGDRSITITDDKGHSTTWPFRLTKGTLVIVIPEKKRSFHLRRYR